MRLRDLVYVLKYIKQAIEENKLVELYTNIVNFLTQVRQNPTPELSKQIKDTRDTLVDLHRKLHPRSWSFVRISILKQYGAYDLIGEAAINQLNSIFLDHQADPGGAANSIQEMKKKTSQLLQRIDQTLQNFGPMAEEWIEEAVDNKESVVQIEFRDKASIKTIKDLESYSKEWDHIISSFSRLTKSPVEDAKVLSVQQSSIVLELVALGLIVVALAKGINEILAVFERILQLKKLALETENLKLRNRKIKKEIEEEAKSELKITADEISDRLLNEYKWGDGDDERNEVRNAISISLLKIFGFIENGGNINTYDPNREKEDEQSLKLRSSFNEVYKLKNELQELKAIEDKTKDSETQPSDEEKESVEK